MFSKLWFELTDEDSITTMCTELFTGLSMMGGIVTLFVYFIIELADELH